ncbi:hypothetical protein [Burkholderia cenocepacia]|nr:hypothetical protein [Burkholderia cenocepacia]
MIDPLLILLDTCRLPIAGTADRGEIVGSKKTGEQSQFRYDDNL